MQALFYCQQLPDRKQTPDGQKTCHKLIDNMTNQRDQYAESFADYLIEAMARRNMRQADLARETGLSRQTISQLAGKRPHALTGKLLLPERETVEAIARALKDDPSIARRAAGYSELPPADRADFSLEIEPDMLRELEVIGAARNLDAAAVARELLAIGLAVTHALATLSQIPPSASVQLLPEAGSSAEKQRRSS